MNEQEHAAAAQEQDAEMFRLLVESVKDYGIFLLDTAGHIIRWSAGAAQIYGYSSQEVIGQSHALFYPPEDRASGRPEQELSAARREGRFEDAGWRLRKDGSRFWISLVTTPLTDSEGSLRGFAKVTRDVTENRRSQEALERLSHRNELILSSAGEGIYGVDLEGRATFVNPAAAAMIGCKPDELLGQPMHAVTHHTKADGSPYPPEECPIYAAFRDGEVHQVTDEVFWRKDGTSFPVDYISTPIREGSALAGAVVTFRDITERKRAEEERQRLVQEVQEAAVRQRILLREILASVTEGKLCLCDSDEDLPEPLAPVGEPLPLSAPALRDLRRRTREVAQQIGLPVERWQDLLMAVGEAGMNAVVHAGDGRAHVHADPQGKVQVWVQDSGQGIAMQELHRATLERGFTTAGTMGHGFWMMLRTCDRIWLLTGAEGTTVVIEQDREEPEPAWLREAA